MGKLINIAICCTVAALALCRFCRTAKCCSQTNCSCQRAPKRPNRTRRASVTNINRVNVRGIADAWNVVNSMRSRQQQFTQRIPGVRSEGQGYRHMPESLLGLRTDYMHLIDRVAHLESREVAHTATISHLVHELNAAYGVSNSLWFY